MEIANLILEYLKVLLNWPLLVLALAWMFREPVSELLRKIRKIGFPGGSLDAEADEASSEVDEVSSVTPPLNERADAAGEEKGPEAAEPQEQLPAALVEPASPAESTSPANEGTGTREFDALTEQLRRWARDSDDSKTAQRPPEQSELSHRRKTVDEGQYYESYRQLALDSPVAAVREAHQRVRIVGRRLLQDARPGWRSIPRSLHEIFQALSEEDLVNPDAMEPARRLDKIHQSAATSNELSAKGALSFVGAAQKLDSLLAEAQVHLDRRRAHRLAQARPAVQALLVGLGFEEEATTAVSRKSIVVNFSTLDREIDAEPRYQSLLRSLDDIARNEAINILVHHPDKRAFSVTKK